MSTDQIEAYLSAALDQEACRDTLISALVSRIISLQARGIRQKTILGCLNNLCNDPYQINDDVIDFVIEWMLVVA